MTKQTVTVVPARGFGVSPSNDSVILSVKTDDKDGHFAFPVDAIPEIVTHMIQAHSDASVAEGMPSKAVNAAATTVAVDEQERTIRLSLMPTESSHFPFSLSIELAEKVIEGLTEAIAALRGQQSSSRH